MGVNGYRIDISKRWFEYRKDILNENNLIKRFENQYQFLLENKLYEREKLVYPNYSFDQQDFSYLLSWTHDRLNYLDDYFDKSLSVLDEIVSIDSHNISLYPNPAKDKIYVKNAVRLINKNYQIFDFSGRLLDYGNIEDDYITVAQLDKGIYLLVLDNKKHTFIIQ